MKYNNNDINSNDNDKRGGDTNDKITNSSFKNFIDEIDKLVSNSDYKSADASSEGVQRDLLPLIEGT